MRIIHDKKSFHRLPGSITTPAAGSSNGQGFYIQLHEKDCSRILRFSS
jgi:hypothetical protein